MGIMDWIILAVLAFFMVQGLRRGLAASLVGIAGTIASFFLASHFYPLVKNSLLINYKMNFILASVVAGILIVVLFVVVLRLVIFTLNRMISAVKLSGLNKLLGLVFGFFNGLLVVMVCMVLLDYLPPLSDPLKNPAKHRIYAAVDTLKTDLVQTLKLKQYDKYLNILDKKAAAKEKEQQG